ncbi:MAG: NeuD/PglB/VioB family sugar acetyltransferase [Rhodospirillum sp.]|nr:NeuD/PglB/VioB family sugar acetyltransferase [Rhodospirillum sp.]MCF8489116.1 NeuD/PglB/VioB family sugar acetyltransferase [Rhodospirillum sp.]MCF8498906.1 NeuD/PglB/VioB family sugar acetyltransferase [Rhodospirillum sp.]
MIPVPFTSEPHATALDRPWIILGAGGHGRVTIDLLARCGAEILGALDANIPAGEQLTAGCIVLGGDDLLNDPRHGPERLWLANGLGTLPGRNTARAALFRDLEGKGYRFPALIHPSAVVAVDVRLGAGVQVMAGAIIQTGATVGTGTIVNTGARVDHDCVIGPHAHVAPGAVLSGGVHVGEGAHLGTGCAVIQGRTVGRGAVVGAGAVVVRDLADGACLVPASQRLTQGPM